MAIMIILGVPIVGFAFLSGDLFSEGEMSGAIVTFIFSVFFLAFLITGYGVKKTNVEGIYNVTLETCYYKEITENEYKSALVEQLKNEIKTKKESE